MKSPIKLFAPLLLGMVLLSSCDKEDDNVVSTVNYKAQLTGTQEVPANNSTATGTFNANYNPATGIMSYTLNFGAVVPTMWHIHKAPVGINGNVVFDLGSIVATPKSGSITLTAEQAADLDADSMYVNIHSIAYPGGEIRGQIVRQ